MIQILVAEHIDLCEVCLNRPLTFHKVHKFEDPNSRASFSQMNFYEFREFKESSLINPHTV